MARVLKQANKNEKLWRKELTCTGAGWQQHGTVPCGRLIEVLATDVEARAHSGWDGTDIYYGFHCPCCHAFTEIPKTTIPGYVQNMAKSRSKL